MKKIIFSLFIFGLFSQTFSQTIDPGNTPGQLNISLTGAATYSIPFSVPPGIKDVVPQIGLAYSSQAGNGIAGWGWNITGLSAITRIPNTIFHDGEVDGVDFDNNDRYAIDGQRLILESGTYGLDGSVYITENYSNVKVKAFGTHPEGTHFGPLYFNVYYPNGNIATYGNNNNSTSKLSWGLSNWVDPQGNTINYFYNTSEPRLITSIMYGSGNNSSTGINAIYFYYQNRNRIESYYMGGVNTLLDKRLSKIEVKYSTSVLRTYGLGYDYSVSDYDRLLFVQEGNSLGNKLNPITFEYGSSNTTIQTSTTSKTLDYDVEDFSKFRVSQGDYNFDGHVDLVVYKNRNTKFNLYEDLNYYGEGITVNTDVIDEIITLNQRIDNKLTGKQSMVVVTDDCVDYANAPCYLENDYREIKFTKYYYNQSNNLVSEAKIWTEAPHYQTQSGMYCSNLIVNRGVNLSYFNGDFNGDGLEEILAIGQPYQMIENCNNAYPGGCSCTQTTNLASSYLIDLENDPLNMVINIGTPFPNFNKKDVFIGEFNGDGKSDLYIFHTGRLSVYGYENGQFQLLHTETNSDILKFITEENALHDKFPVVVGDYNGDGLTDFICPNTTINYNTVGWSYYLTWRVFLSNGKTFTQESYTGEGYTRFEFDMSYEHDSGSVTKWDYIATDINGDGRSDLVVHKTERGSDDDDNEYLQIFTNVKQNAPSSPNIFNLSRDYSYSNGDSQISASGFPIFIDSNHQNFSNEYAYIGYHPIDGPDTDDDNINIKRYFSTTNIRPNFLLNKVINNSVETTIEYGTLTPDNVNFEESTEATYPNINVNFSPFTYIVNKISENGGGITRSQDFYYKGFTSNALGLGFLGPKEHKRSSWYGNGVSKIWSISQHDFSLRGAVTTQYTSLLNEGFENDYISKSENTYNTTIGANKVFTNLPIQTVQTDALQGLTTTSINTYDSYNNVIESTSTFIGGYKRIELQYSNNPSPFNNTYHIGKPIHKTETNFLDPETVYKEEEYSYSNNLMIQSKIKGIETDWVTESLEYDTFGNITKKTLSAPDIANRVENFTYDTSGRFLIKSFDIEGLMTQYAYNTIYGYLNSETNPYGLTTSYLYDGWSRMIRSTDYLGNQTNYSVLAIANGGIRKTIDYPQGADVVTEYNAFGWELNSKVLALNNKWVKTVANYDVLGRKTAVSEPFFDTESPTQWTTSSYDSYGRLISIIEPTGKTTITTYNGLNTTVEDGVKSMSSTKDAAGNIITMTDLGGTVNYSYFANGVMKEANYGGHIVSTEIDGWGRKIGLSDPDAGHYGYEYNSIGELLAESTPNGITYYTYDNYGKTISKQIVGNLTDMNTTYTYNSSTKLLMSIMGTNTVNGVVNDKTQTFVYDNYKRIKEVNETSTSDQVNFNQKSTFDTLGRVATSEYNSTHAGQSSQVKTQNIYDSYGNLIQIKDYISGTILWQLNNENARGQMLQVTLGNGAKKTRSYDEYGLIKRMADTKLGSSRPPVTPTVNMLRLTYNFNPQRGLLNTRENTNFSWNEAFTYDSQERLTQISGAVNFTQNYDERGRIDNNTKVGEYNYVSGNYAVKTIDLNTIGENYYLAHALQQISYNAIKKPVDIYEQGNGRVSFEYDPITLDRTRAYYGSNHTDKLQRPIHKYYSGIIPVEITKNITTGEIKFVTFVGGDAYSAPIIHVKQTGATPINAFYYLHRDYLGSIMAISNSSGALVEQRQFGAWGVVDKFLNSSGATVFNDFTSLLNRGYTGHEHFFGVSLINMNGRMYDPVLGRFLSPDNFVQDPYNSQSYNRYGYVLNNPLMYTDPSGEIIPILIAIGVGMLIDYGIQVTMNYINGYRGADAWVNKIDYFDIFVSGGLSGLTLGFGNAFTGGKAVGKFGMFFINHPNTVTSLGVGLTSAVDITGEGFQPVTFNQFAQRVVTGLAVQKATNVIGKALKGKSPEVTTTSTISNESIQESVQESVEKNLDDQLNTEDLFQDITPNTGTNSVYVGVNPETNIIEYVGITKRTPEIRWNEHLNSTGTGKDKLFYLTLDGATENLNTIQARIIEQRVINQLQLGNLINIRNSIAPKYWSTLGIKY
jgi:RHS repeat-associated protein